MQLDVIGRDLEISDALNRHAERRASFAFDRVADRIRRVQIRLAGDGSSRGGDARHCQVRVELGRGGALVVEEHDADAYTAIDRTLGRMKQILRDHLGRDRSRRERRREHPRRGS